MIIGSHLLAGSHRIGTRSPRPRRPRLVAGDLAYDVLNRRMGRLSLFGTPSDYAALETILA